MTSCLVLRCLAALHVSGVESVCEQEDVGDRESHVAEHPGEAVLTGRTLRHSVEHHHTQQQYEYQVLKKKIV